MAIWKSAFGDGATVIAPHRTYVKEARLEKHSKLVSSRKMYTFILLSDALLYGMTTEKAFPCILLFLFGLKEIKALAQ